MQHETSMELVPHNALFLDMAGSGDRFSIKAVAYRLELARVALGFKKKSDFIAKVPGLRSDLWFNYTGSANTPPRDCIPPDMAAAICRAFPDVTTDWIYLGNKESMKLRMIEALEAAEKAVQSHSKSRRANKNG